MAREFNGAAITTIKGNFEIRDAQLMINEHNALYIGPGFSDNLAVGRNALLNIEEVADQMNNIAVGSSSGQNITTGVDNVLVGRAAGISIVDQDENTACGSLSLFFNNSGSGNTAIGLSALSIKQDTSNNTDSVNCVGLGANSRVSADNQVQLGDSATTTFAYGAVQDRSDERDKADIIDSDLGLSFIEKVRPVKFRWDMRDDYFIKKDDEIEKLPRDGSKKRSRFHYGVIAQELKEVMDDLGIDFGGYQDHSMSPSGCDVLSVGYTEFIGPLIKAVQELSERVAKLESK